MLVSVAKLMVKRFLNYEADQLAYMAGSGESTTVAFLEQFVQTTISINFLGKELNILVKGFIDRVDYMDGWWKIIDYKTGTTESKQVKVKVWDDLIDNPDLNIGFQLMMYAYLLSCRFKTPVVSSAGIISLKRINAGFTSISVPGEDPVKLTSMLDKTSTTRFEEVIRTILADIYDLAKPFTQTSEVKICERCPYINLCGR